MKRVLITGAEGFTGRYLAQRLRQDDWDVVGLVHRPVAPEQAFGIPQIALDLLDGATLAPAIAELCPDAVIHLAGVSSPAHGNIAEIYLTNLLGTRNLLDALVRAPRRPHKIVLASSANIYHPRNSGQIDETAQVGPANDYGVSKLAMEHLRGVFGSELPITVVRPFNYTGVGQSARFVLPKIIDALRAGAEFVELGNIDVSRDWSDVRFVVDCYARLLRADAAAQGPFNICSGRAISVRELIDLACTLAGRSIDIRFNPQFARPNEIPMLWGKNERLAEAIGPLEPIAPEDTIGWMLSSH